MALWGGKASGLGMSLPLRMRARACRSPRIGQSPPNPEYLQNVPEAHSLLPGGGRHRHNWKGDYILR